MKHPIATVLAGAILVATSACEGASPESVYLPYSVEIPAADAVITTEQSVYIQDVYTRIRGYWQGSTTAELVLLSGNEHTSCGTDERGTALLVNSRHGAAYCAAEQKIIITGLLAAVDAPRYAKYNPMIEKAGMVFVVAHEYGHHQQTEWYGRQALQIEGEELRQKELEADRLAGRAMCGANYSYDAIALASMFMRNLNETSDHGTNQERVGAFREGAESEGC